MLKSEFDTVGATTLSFCKMKILWISLIAALLCCNCATQPRVKVEKFVATESPIDRNLDQATIEDYIIALPPYAFHEERVEQFREKVYKARASDEKNKGRDRDSLFIQGQGANSSMEFTLDRETNILSIKVYCWEPGTTPYETTMRRVPGGWMEGPQTKLTGGYHIE